MKRYIVSWWCGQEVVTANSPEKAKEVVGALSEDYREYGRNAPLFVKEV